MSLVKNSLATANEYNFGSTCERPDWTKAFPESPGPAAYFPQHGSGAAAAAATIGTPALAATGLSLGSTSSKPSGMFLRRTSSAAEFTTTPFKSAGVCVCVCVCGVLCGLLKLLVCVCCT
jgi:hypothetical protein